MENEDQFVTLTKLAEICGISLPTARMRCGGVTRRAGRFGTEYSLREGVQCLLKQEPMGGKSEGEDEDEGESEIRYDPVQERARLDHLRAEKMKLDLKTRKNELVPVSKVLPNWKKVTAGIRNKILSVPKAIAHEVTARKSPAEAEEIMRKALEIALRETAHEI